MPFLVMGVEPSWCPSSAKTKAMISRKILTCFFFGSNAGGDLGTLNAAVDITDANLALNRPLGNVRVEAEDADDVGDYVAGYLTTISNVGLVVEADSGSASIFVAARAVAAQTKAAGEIVLTFGFETY